MNYLEWNSRLFADVIDRGDPHRGLYLYVDSDLLAKLSGLSPVQAVEDFCRAFRIGIGDSPFRRGATAATKWRREGFSGNPPFVADLAMTVLAVTEGPINGSIYARQNDLLGLPAVKAAPDGYDIYVNAMWRTWNSWLEGPGSIHGRPTASPHPHWSLQGWARSQGLIRQHDRLQIESYIASYGTEFAAFRSWLVLHRPSFLDRFREVPAMDILQTVFGEEAARLVKDGPRARVTNGSQSQMGLLGYDQWTGMLFGAMLIDDSWAGREVFLSGGERHMIDDHEALIQVPLTADQALLSVGVQHRLTDEIVVRFGGDSVYVMRDDVRADAMLQVRSVEHPTVADLLVHPSLMTQVAKLLATVGLTAKQSSAGVGDWTWFHNVTLSPAQPSVLAGLGVGRTTRDERRCSFYGGQQVRPHLYLVGGEPDVHFSGHEPVTEVIINGQQYPITMDDQRLVMSSLALPPGQYRIESRYGTLSLRTEDYVQHTPVHSNISRPVTRFRHGYIVGAADQDGSAETKLAGAALDGIAAHEPIVIRKSPNAETLMITEAGEVSEVVANQPAWLGEAGLRPDAIDVLATIRNTVSPVAYFLVRGVNRRVQAINVPREAPRFEGTAPIRPRPDLVAPLALGFREWSWIGHRHPRVGKIMSTVLSASKQPSPTTPPAWRCPAPATTRTTVAENLIAENPFDDVLTWLSERENGSVSVNAFAETWSWLCHRHNLPGFAFYWRRALKALEDLGHVERHYATARVGVTPAALIALPASSGLYLLAGARPQQLVERLDDPDDHDSTVADAVANWQISRRTPVDSEGRPSGPQAIYVEWDPAARDTVRQGLQTLGVKMYGLVADALLAMQPAITDLDASGTQLTMSPSNEIHQRRATTTGTYAWTPVLDDARAGLYSYQLRTGRVFAWRPAVGTALVKVEFSVGDWLLRASDGKTSLLQADESGRRRLAVPESVPLPRMVARALVLRSGLPPRVGPIGAGSTNYVIYENVDSTTTRTVAQLLGQQPVPKMITTARQG